ncbi:MAG: hypothetical protein RLZZ244_2524 [Verrucomicrobiota bacterium]|jgi:DNA-binding transcriptional MerR regulator/methylmalonyl-CoA mutase cobalamin-binding subunit
MFKFSVPGVVEPAPPRFACDHTPESVPTMRSSVSIRHVAQRTGLTAHVIRAWERRYQILDPNRSDGGHRVYTESDIERISLLASVVRTGRAISTVASLSNDALRELLATPPEGSERPRRAHRAITMAAGFQEKILNALKDFKTRTIYDILDQGQVALGWNGLLQLVIAPTAEQVGEHWREGLMTTAHEHLFTSTIKVFLGNLTRQYGINPNAPRIVISTPSGQYHELGALLTAACAANIGWETAYLGPSLPAAELVGAVVQFKAKVLALSIVYPNDDPNVASEIREIGKLMPKDVHLIAGGRAASAYAAELREIGAQSCANLQQFCGCLDNLRRSPAQIPDSTWTRA